MSDDNKYAMVKGNTIKANDIVSIKFKPLEEILMFFKQDGHRVTDILDELSIDDHLSTIINGGIFFVKEVKSNKHSLSLLEHRASRNKSGKLYERPHEVILIDHHSNGDTFKINEHMIESIEVKDDVGEVFFSNKFQISMVRLDGCLLINGEPVTSEDKKLISILEKPISDLSIRSMFENLEEN